MADIKAIYSDMVTRLHAEPALGTMQENLKSAIESY